MKNNKLIAEALLEIAQRAKTTFIDIGKEDKELIEAAKKFNIELPSPDLMVMKTVYAEIDKVNKNGVVLPKKAVEEGLKTLIGKQCNWEHDGAGFVCGYTIEAKINEDKIETINVLFKSLFPDKAEELKEKIKSNEAAVSFEIWNIDPQTKKSVVKSTDNGYVEISPIIFHGTGVLLTHKPACPNAKVFKLIANKEINEAEQIVSEIFDRNLIYASLAIENEKEANEVTKENKSDEKIVPSSEETKTENKTEETKVEEIQKADETKKENKPEEKTETAETKSEEKKVEETKEEVIPQETPKVEAETKGKEQKVEKKEEKAQEIETVVPKIVSKITRIYSDIFIDTYKDGTLSGTSEGKSLSKTITEYTDGTQDVVEAESEYKKKYDFAEVEEKVNAAKAEKDAEIATLKADYAKQIETKDTEIKNKNEELGKKDQEIAVLKTNKDKEVATAKENELVVGNTEIEGASDIQEQADNINKIIAKKGKY